MTSGQETERVYSYNPGACMGLAIVKASIHALDVSYMILWLLR